MGVSARIAAFLLLFSYAIAVPAIRQAHNDAYTGDLAAESSEIITEAVAAPHSLQHKLEDTVAAADESDRSIELEGGAQNFFPSFASLFEPRQQNNLKLSFGNQEGAFSQRPNSYRSLFNYPGLFGNYRNLDGFSKQEVQPAQLVDTSSSVLGSGNFGIIRGGTFGAQNDEDDYDQFFYNNGHSSPSLGVGYIANPRPNFNQDQFANFRDFADINSPANSAYSHYVVVYANKNATMDEVSEETRKVLSKPKNIIETLESLDEMPSPPKISKSKAKLRFAKQKLLNKKEQWKMGNLKKYYSRKHDVDEPLLALS